MEGVWDSSALVALIFAERHSPEASAAYALAVRLSAWEWSRVEVAAALQRRRATPVQWAQWQMLEAAILWTEVRKQDLDALIAFNAPLRLRAADAGVLFCAHHLSKQITGLQLITFDQEMIAAAVTLTLAIWHP